MAEKLGVDKAVYLVCVFLVHSQLALALPTDRQMVPKVSSSELDSQLPWWPCPPSEDSTACYTRIVSLYLLGDTSADEPCPEGSPDRDYCILQFLRKEWFTLANVLLERAKLSDSLAQNAGTLPQRSQDLCPPDMDDMECLSLLAGASADDSKRNSKSGSPLKTPTDLNSIRVSQLLAGLPAKSTDQIQTRGLLETNKQTNKRAGSRCPPGVHQVDCFHYYTWGSANANSHNQFVGRR